MAHEQQRKSKSQLGHFDNHANTSQKRSFRNLESSPIVNNINSKHFMTSKQLEEYHSKVSQMPKIRPDKAQWVNGVAQLFDDRLANRTVSRHEQQKRGGAFDKSQSVYQHATASHGDSYANLSFGGL